MLEFIDLNKETVVGFQIAGKVTQEDFATVAEAIEERLKHHDKISIYAEVTSFEGMSVETFFKDAMFGLRNWNRFSKEALVTDKAWLRNAAEIGGKLTPGIDVKAFTVAETSAAREWVKA